MTKTIETPAVNLQHPKREEKNLALRWLACVRPQGYHNPSYEVIETEKVVTYSLVTLWLVLFPPNKTVASTIPGLWGLCVRLHSQSPLLSRTPSKELHLRLIDNCAINWSLVQSVTPPMSRVCWDRLHHPCSPEHQISSCRRWKGWCDSWKHVGKELAVKACLYWLHLRTGWLKAPPTCHIPHTHTHDQPQNCNATDVNQPAN